MWNTPDIFALYGINEASSRLFDDCLLLCSFPFAKNLLVVAYVFDRLRGAAAVIVGVAEFTLIDKTEEGVNNVGGKLCAGVLLDDRDDLVEIHTAAVRTV